VNFVVFGYYFIKTCAVVELVASTITLPSTTPVAMEPILSSKPRFDIKTAGQVSVIGVPFSGGQPRDGVDLAPGQMRQLGVIEEIRKLGWKVQDVGDVALPKLEQNDISGRTKRPRYVGGTCKSLHDMVTAEAKKGNFVLTIGGDHSIAAGSISGILSTRPDTCIIWVDAHADINTHETSPSGNIHGMPVAFLLALTGMRTTPGFEWMRDVPILTPSSIVYIGLRDVDPGEQETLHRLGITAFSMHEVDKFGISEVMQRAMNKINPDRSRPLHLSFDVDGIDNSLVPATGTAVPGGLNYRETRYICEYCYGSGLLASLDLVEINPKLSDEAGRRSTLETSLMLVKAVFGKTLLKSYPEL